MGTITLPPPDQIRQRIDSCVQELKSLRRLLRMSQDMRDAEEAGQRRQTLEQEGAAPTEGVPHAR
jgi:hypothetical protein